MKSQIEAKAEMIRSDGIYWGNSKPLPTTIRHNPEAGEVWVDVHPSGTELEGEHILPVEESVLFLAPEHATLRLQHIDSYACNAIRSVLEK